MASRTSACENSAAGILRCMGARARQIRRVLSAEAVVLAFVGWAFGVLLGWLISEGLLALLLRTATRSLPQEFPPSIPLVIRGPLRRASRTRPGTALRYQ